MVSFTRRDGRLHPQIARAWRPRHEEWFVHPPRGEREASLDPGWVFDPVAAFGREAPLIVEIGSGTGEAVLASAAERPDADHLAVEVYRPGAAKTVIRAERRGLSNVRVVQADAAALLRTALAPGTVSEIRVFFPDPWPKLKHHKRRLVGADMLRDAARALRPGGVIRLATDWADYARAMLEAAAEVAELDNPHHGVAPRFAGRPPTKFERKALAEGRAVTDVELVRRPGRTSIKSAE